MAKLRTLLENLEVTALRGSLEAALDQEITALVYDSRKITKDCLFVCIEGANFDGHSAAAQAVSQGAAVLVVQKPVEVPKDSEVLILQVESTRYALAFLSAAWFGHPASKLKTIGITGTKGKTTSTYLVKSILENAGLKVGLVGTIEVIIGDTHIHAENTTPESYVLQSYFARMVEEGCDAVVMEVSSQGIKMRRTDGLFFDYGLFTNISPDHIGPDEHKDFAEYLYYKSQLLNMCKVGIVNRLDPHYEQIVEHASCKLYTYGVNVEDEIDVDFSASNIRYVAEPGFVGTEFDVKGRLSMEVRLGIPGIFNVDNALAAVSLSSFFGLNPEEMNHGLERIRVNGRMEIVYSSPLCTVLVDYAHNAVSMESLLKTLRDYHPKRLVCVFGCGGNRSKERRYSMGEIGGKLADLCILTADNSRYEKTEDIIADIRSSIEKTGGAFLEIPDRREAIRYSMFSAQPGDMIAVIGKGHEDYQIIGREKIHFDDVEEIEKAFAGGTI